MFPDNFNQQNQQTSSSLTFNNGQDPRRPIPIDPTRNQQSSSSVIFNNGQDPRRPIPIDPTRNQQSSSSLTSNNNQDPRRPIPIDQNQNQQTSSSLTFNNGQEPRRPILIDQDRNQQSSSSLTFNNGQDPRRPILIDPTRNQQSSSSLTSNNNQDPRRPVPIDQNQHQQTRTDFASAQLRLQQEVLQSHNSYRARHCVPPLQLDDNLSRSAQIYAERLARANGGLQNQASGVGQNTYMKVTSAYLDYINGEEPTNYWYNGARYYDYNRGGFSMNTGSFTQLVWKGSRQLGVGIAYADSGRSAYVVAQYYPAGNVLNDFQNNVVPAKC